MRIPFLSGLIATSVLFYSPQTARGQSQAIPDEAIPADLVLQLLDHDVQQLTVDRLPDGLPTQIPLPEDATVLAGIVYRVEEVDDELIYWVVLDVAQSSEALAVQYQEQLEQSGWALSTSGFIPSFTLIDDTLSFCNSEDGLAIDLWITLQESNSAGLDIFLFAVPENFVGCGDIVLESGIPMPSLSPPEAADVAGYGLPLIFPDGATTGAAIETTLGIEAIAQHYAEQWEAAGWQLLDSEESGDAVESTWTFEDEADRSWRGTLTIEPMENEPGRYKGIASVEAL